MFAPTVISLLGPQRTHPIIGRVADDLGLDGPVAVISAGWMERETEDEQLAAALGRPIRNLRLYERATALFADDPAMLAAHLTRLDALRRASQRYEIRLSHAMDALAELGTLARSWATDDASGERPAPATERDAVHAIADAVDGRSDELAFDDHDARAIDEQADALHAVRQLDTRHAEQVAEIEEAFEHAVRPRRHARLRALRDEIAAELDGTVALAIAGGNVRVLRQTIRAFGIDARLADRPLLAWAGGAMCVGERIMLYHDDPPQGFDHPQVHASGLGLVAHTILLPHARTRLRLDDPGRVSRFARRCAPEQCLTLDEGSRLDVRDGRIVHAEGVRVLDASGEAPAFAPYAHASETSS